MRTVDIILKKRNSKELTDKEINFLINGYVKGDIPDYQISAFLMAVWFNSMTERETFALTDAMIKSGDVMDLSYISGTKTDKHSTGGVGDKTTITLAPLIASFGIPVAKLSGRGLGHTGGTLDKLESIPGFRVDLSESEFIDSVKTHGISISGQTADIVPADKLLYALRDVTGTVDSIPLIASSIMSKKIASGADKIMLDVKTGDGAFMKTVFDAETLAHEMIKIGESFGKETVAYITDMNEPLGYAVGNSLEVIEAIDTLKGKGPEDFTELCVTLAARELTLSGMFTEFSDAKKSVENALKTSAGIPKLRELIKAQGGNSDVIEDYSLLPTGKNTKDYVAENSGYVSKIKAENIGIAAMKLGAGRASKEDKIDLGAGIKLKVKTGDYVNKGETLCRLYFSDVNPKDAEETLSESFVISDEKPAKRQLIYNFLDKSNR